jgi:tRNA nucleotidyltransferase (CCA-adding enzyme)
VAHKELARMTCKQHTNVHRALELRPETALKLLEECDAFRRPERFREMLLACQCDAQGRTGLETKAYPQRDYLEQVLTAAAAAVLAPEVMQGLAGQAIAAKLREQRLTAITALRKSP